MNLPTLSQFTLVGERLDQVGCCLEDSNRDCVILPPVMWSKPMSRSIMMSMTANGYQVAVKRFKMRFSIEIWKLDLFLP